MKRSARLARSSARSGRFAPGARSVPANRAGQWGDPRLARPSDPHPDPSSPRRPRPKSVTFSMPIPVTFSTPIDSRRVLSSPRPRSRIGAESGGGFRVGLPRGCASGVRVRPSLAPGPEKRRLRHQAVEKVPRAPTRREAPPGRGAGRVLPPRERGRNGSRKRFGRHPGGKAPRIRPDDGGSPSLRGRIPMRGALSTGCQWRSARRASAWSGPERASGKSPPLRPAATSPRRDSPMAVRGSGGPSGPGEGSGRTGRLSPRLTAPDECYTSPSPRGASRFTFNKAERAQSSERTLKSFSNIRSNSRTPTRTLPVPGGGRPAVTYRPGHGPGSLSGHPCRVSNGSPTSDFVQPTGIGAEHSPGSLRRSRISNWRV